MKEKKIIQKLTEKQIVKYIADKIGSTLDEIKQALLYNFVIEEISIQVAFNRENKE